CCWRSCRRPRARPACWPRLSSRAWAPPCWAPGWPRAGPHGPAWPCWLRSRRSASAPPPPGSRAGHLLEVDLDLGDAHLALAGADHGDRLHELHVDACALAQVAPQDAQRLREDLLVEPWRLDHLQPHRARLLLHHLELPDHEVVVLEEVR